MTSIAEGVTIVDAGNNLARVLRTTTQCTCVYDEPYPDGEKRKTGKGLKQRCQRCLALARWANATDQQPENDNAPSE